MRAATALFILLLIPFAALASEEVLIVEQDYNIIEQSREGPEAKDIRQKLYINKDWVCIDEFGGKAGSGSVPTESIFVDLKNKKIVDLDHENKKMVTETFDARRKRIESRKKNNEDDLEAQPAGPQREKLAKLYRALLDDKRHFKLDKDAQTKKALAGAECKEIKILDADDPQYVPLQAFLHPSVEMPYDNSEVLYLLQIIGEHLAKFLRDNKATFKYVPMELHLDLAAGGRLDTKVVSVTRTEKKKLEARGTLGMPFDIPAGYEERIKKPTPKTDAKPERAD